MHEAYTIDLHQFYLSVIHQLVGIAQDFNKEERHTYLLWCDWARWTYLLAA